MRRQDFKIYIALSRSKNDLLKFKNFSQNFNRDLCIHLQIKLIKFCPKCKFLVIAFYENIYNFFFCNISEKEVFNLLKGI